MTIPTFDPPVSPSAGMETKPEVRILKAEFGDGYTQPTRDGLNHIRSVITMRWEVLTKDERDEVIGFITAQGGDKPFFYQQPNSSTALKFTCDEWSQTALQANLFSVDAVFRQCFNHG